MHQITPSHDHPLPDNLAEEIAPTLQENVRIATATASLMMELGMPFEMTEKDEAAARELFAQVDKKKGPNDGPAVVNPPALYQGNVAVKLSALLNEYDHKVVLDAAQARTYIMNRLLEISHCGDAKAELRALELMGKMSDVGAFTEKSEVTITHRKAGDLKQILQEKITRLIDGAVIDVPTRDVKTELGVVTGETVSETGEEAGAIDDVEEKVPSPEDELDAYIAERAQKVQETSEIKDK